MKPLNSQTQGSWQEALRHVRELNSRCISDSEWDVLTAWLLKTEFDGTSFLAGEAAALLIRDRASAHVKEQLDRATESAEGWTPYRRLIFLPEDHPNRLKTIGKCCVSQILLIQQQGMIAMRSQPASSLLELRSDERALPRSVNRTITRQSQPAGIALGTIKKLTDKGFGFIVTTGSTDLFFHSKSLEGVRFEELFEGQRVSFSEGRGPKGPCAENIKRI